MAYTQTVAMSDIVRWTVWISDTVGEFVRANKVQEQGGYVIFKKNDVEVARYKKSEIKDYNQSV